MEKNRRFRSLKDRIMRKKMFARVVKVLIGIILVFPAQAQEKQQRVSLFVEQQTVVDIFKLLEQQVSYKFLYHDADILKLGKKNLTLKDVLLTVALDSCLKGSAIGYEFVGTSIVFKRLERREESRAVRITGAVEDEFGNSLPGVTVLVEGTTIGVTTDENGNFGLVIPQFKEVSLVFSFVGMKKQVVKLSMDSWGVKQEKLKVVLVEENVRMEDVVVTGYANLSRQSFTGNAKTVTADELKKVSQTNVLKSLQVLDPSFRLTVNNEMGSNPNALPNISIRGASGIGVTEFDSEDLSETALRNNPNLPTFIMDGFEVSVEKLYDLDINRIESITLLKDAAATAIYGSRAANGVVVITTVAPQPGEVLITYNYNLEVQLPDLRDYNLMNAREKLEAEKEAGLFDENVWGIRYYNEKLRLLEKGVETDWLYKPLRNVANSKHFIRLEGGAKGLRYAIDMNYYGNNGVMKDSERKVYGIGFELQYRAGKLTFRNATGYTGVNEKESPYGSFSDYTTMNPYLPYLDDDGTMLEIIPVPGSTDVPNPLYDATLGSYDKKKTEEFYNNFSVQYFLSQKLNFKATLALTRKIGNSSEYISPQAGKYATTTYKGELTLGDNSETSIDGSLFGYYNDIINSHNINFVFGVNLRERKNDEETYYLRDLPAGGFSSPQFAREMAKSPNAFGQTNRLFGAMMSLNYTYDNIYLMDLTGRLDGNSSFGSDSRFAPFWSVGLGINIHNYHFAQNLEWLSEFKIRGSYGITGKADFPAKTARTVYTMNSDYVYATGVGGNITAMGNKKLKWERTKISDIGISLGLLGDKLRVNGSYYVRRTLDLIADMYLPSSSGFLSYKDNVGEITNKGFELDLRWRVFSTNKMQLYVNGNLAANKNRIEKISEALKSYNKRVEDSYAQNALIDRKPMLKFVEGASTTSIYAMRSLGIDPQTGKEMFISKDGTVGNKWIASENVAVGNTEPKINGSISTNFYYRGLTLDLYFTYTYGGQQYNQTLQSKIENANIEKNVDKRVFTDRWKNEGDICQFKSLKDYRETTNPTTRFVQDDNTLTFQSLSLGYELPDRIVQKLYLNKVRFSFNMNDVFRLSTIRQERGLSYPFSRGYSFSLNIGI